MNVCEGKTSAIYTLFILSTVFLPTVSEGYVFWFNFNFSPIQARNKRANNIDYEIMKARSDGQNDAGERKAGERKKSNSHSLLC